MGRPRMPRIALPPHVHRTVSRGHEYFAYHPFRGTKRAGKRVPLPGAPQNIDGSLNAEWWAKYRELSGEVPAHQRQGSIAALIVAYQASPEWAALADSTRSDWSRYLGYVKSIWADRNVEALEPKHILALRDTYADMPPAPPAVPTKPLEEYADRPAAANNLLRSFSAMLAWSIPRGWRADNPCDHVPKFKGGDGYAPWSWEDIALFRKHAAKRFVIAQALALYTGQRLGDVLAMTRSDIKSGLIAVIQEKTGTKLWIPMHRDLKPLLADLVHESVTILVNSDGLPWTKDGFKASWNKQLSIPELSELRTKRLVFHGLRKSAVVFLLEAGCTDAEVSAITGQSREMVEHYAKQVNQRRLAAAAILKWETAERKRTKRAKNK